MQIGPAISQAIGNNEIFSSKISVKPCKLEYSYLVCRLMIMYFIMGFETSFLMLILPCFCQIFFLSIL